MPNKNQRKRGFPFPLYFARIKQQTASGNGPGILEGFHLNIMHLVNALPGVAAQGLIWGIMAIGVYITFRILDVADLTVDGTMATGGATFIMLTMAGAPMQMCIRDRLRRGEAPPPGGPLQLGRPLLRGPGQLRPCLLYTSRCV